ncbi:MAG: NUDIX domain-containing protein [Propioniciclava sp.]
MAGPHAPRIIVKAYGVLIHPDGERFLVVRFGVGDEVCHRIPGGKVEFLELSAATLVRELHEEFGIEITDPVPIGVLENMSDDGAGRHDVIFTFAHRLVETPIPDAGGYFADDGGTYWAEWRLFDATSPDLFPAGLDHLLPNALAWT